MQPASVMLSFYRLAIVFGAVSSVCWSELAIAQSTSPTRVVVMPFSGEGGGELRTALSANLAEQPGIAVIANNEVKQAQANLGLSKLRDADYPRLASALQARAFLHGSVRKQQRGWVLTVMVRKGADGSIVGKATWQGRTLRPLKEIRRNGYSKLAGYLTRAFHQAPPPAVASTNQGTAWWEAKPTAANWWVSSEETPTGNHQDYHVLRITALGGIQYRSMEATIMTSLDPTKRPLEQRSYESSLPGHAEFGIEAEFYPFAIKGLPEFPYLGLIGNFRHSLLLQGEACEVLSVPGAPCDPGQTRQMSTSQWELYGALRGRVRPWGQTQYDLEFQAELGLGTFNFLFDTSELLDLSGINPAAVIPPFSYKYVHLGIGASYGVVPQWLTLALRTGYRLGLGVGADALKIWGTGGEEGPAKPSGFMIELEGRSEAPYIVEGLFFGLRLSYFFFSTEFSGQPACEDDTDGCTAGEPWPPWPEEDGQIGGLLEPVTDHYFRAAFMIGYTWPPPFVIK